MVFSRFYSYPPAECQWPFILRRLGWKPLPCEHEILDVGILDLKEPPHRYSEEKLKTWKQEETGGWKVVPDCFDLPGEFGIHVDFDTMDYSFQLLERFYCDDDRDYLMPVIQGRSGDYQSFKDYVRRIKKQYEPGIIGVSGSLCRSKDTNLVRGVLKMVQRELPGVWVHAFALRFSHLRGVNGLIDSFDSTNWTFPRTSGRGSCRNKEERIQYFYDYIRRLEMVNVHLHEGQGVLV